VHCSLSLIVRTHLGDCGVRSLKFDDCPPKGNEPGQATTKISTVVPCGAGPPKGENPQSPSPTPSQPEHLVVRGSVKWKMDTDTVDQIVAAVVCGSPRSTSGQGWARRFPRSPEDRGSCRLGLRRRRLCRCRLCRCRLCRCRGRRHRRLVGGAGAGRDILRYRHGFTATHRHQLTKDPAGLAVVVDLPPRAVGIFAGDPEDVALLPAAHQPIAGARSAANVDQVVEHQLGDLRCRGRRLGGTLCGLGLCGLGLCGLGGGGLRALRAGALRAGRRRPSSA
jgi:hypothetical protein